MTVSFQAQWLTPMLTGIKKVGRFAKETGRLAVDQVQFDSFSGELKNLTKGVEVNGKRSGGDGFHNFKNNIKSSWTKSVTEAGKSSFWKNTGTSLKEMFSECKDAFKGNGFFKGLKGSGSAIYKKMPLVGNLISVAFAVPTIYKAFAHKENGGGFWTGIKEIGKEALKLGLFALGCAVGTAVGGPLLGMAVGMGVQFLTEKFITGKSFATKEAEAKEAAANQKALNTTVDDVQNKWDKTPEEQVNKANNTAPADNTRVASPNASEVNFEGADLNDEQLLNLTRKNKAQGSQTGSATAPAATDFTSQYSFNPGGNAASNGMSKNFFQQSYMDQDFMAMNAGLISG